VERRVTVEFSKWWQTRCSLYFALYVFSNYCPKHDITLVAIIDSISYKNGGRFGDLDIYYIILWALRSYLKKGTMTIVV